MDSTRLGKTSHLIFQFINRLTVSLYLYGVCCSFVFFISSFALKGQIGELQILNTSLSDFCSGENISGEQYKQ